MIRIASTTVYKGRVFSIDVDRVKLRSGVERFVDVVRHPASVVLVPMPDPGTVVLVRQYRYPVGQYLWELPAGTLEAGEDPDEAARRECEEETGFAPTQIERLGRFYAVPGYGDEAMIFYKLTGLNRPEHPKPPDEDEDLEIRIATLEDARAMVRHSEIIDMKSALALTLI